MIQLENINKAFGSRRVLINYDLEVKEGETFVIMGPSGIGKSVTLKHMVGLLRPDSGTVVINGHEVSTASRSELLRMRREIGYLFQSGALLNWMSVGDNVALPLRESRERRHRLKADEIERRVIEELATVNMASERDKFPAEISGGMRKRAALARVLVTGPKIILYDEPTAGLDPRMSSTISNLITSVQSRFGVTSVVVTHDLSHAYEVGDRIGMMHLGRLIEIGTPEEIRRTRNPVVRDFIEGRPILSMDEETQLGMHLP